MTTITQRVIPIFHDYLMLKKLRRTGWQMRGIRDCESLADHCYGVNFLTLVLAELCDIPGLNPEKALKMAVIHEIAESRVGDIPFPALEFLSGKSAAEQAAARAILQPLGEKAAQSLEALFIEFEENRTTEARFVKAVDKLEMLITAFDYERTGIRSLQDFWDNTTTFQAFEAFPDLMGIARHLAAERLTFGAGR
jgi:putative hydrolase of HD superfamily